MEWLISDLHLTVCHETPVSTTISFHRNLDLQSFEFCNRLRVDNCITVLTWMSIEQSYYYFAQLMDSGMAHCTCAFGFFGDHCELHRPCDVYSCKNNATCVHTPQSDVCYCKPGFAGESLNDCTPSIHLTRTQTELTTDNRL